MKSSQNFRALWLEINYDLNIEKTLDLYKIISMEIDFFIILLPILSKIYQFHIFSPTICRHRGIFPFHHFITHLIENLSVSSFFSNNFSASGDTPLPFRVPLDLVKQWKLCRMCWLGEEFELSGDAVIIIRALQKIEIILHPKAVAQEKHWHHSFRVACIDQFCIKCYLYNLKASSWFSGGFFSNTKPQTLPIKLRKWSGNLDTELREEIFTRRFQPFLPSSFKSCNITSKIEEVLQNTAVSAKIIELRILIELKYDNGSLSGAQQSRGATVDLGPWGRGPKRWRKIFKIT